MTRDEIESLAIALVIQGMPRGRSETTLIAEIEEAWDESEVMVHDVLWDLSQRDPPRLVFRAERDGTKPLSWRIPVRTPPGTSSWLRRAVFGELGMFPYGYHVGDLARYLQTPEPDVLAALEALAAEGKVKQEPTIAGWWQEKIPAGARSKTRVESAPVGHSEIEAHLLRVVQEGMPTGVGEEKLLAIVGALYEGPEEARDLLFSMTQGPRPRLAYRIPPEAAWLIASERNPGAPILWRIPVADPPVTEDAICAAALTELVMFPTGYDAFDLGRYLRVPSDALLLALHRLERDGKARRGGERVGWWRVAPPRSRRSSLLGDGCGPSRALGGGAAMVMTPPGRSRR